MDVTQNVKKRPRRACVVTAGHLSTSPRMVKVADTLSSAGYRVRVVSTYHVDWATTTDAAVVAVRPGRWSWRVVDFRRHGGTRLYLTSGIRSRAARWIASRIGAAHLGAGLAARARDRVFPELVAAALEEPADFIYGGGGALAATAEAARRMNVPFALDLEDFHTGEYADSPETLLANRFTTAIEREVLPRATLLTAGSKGIAEAYRERYGVTAIPMNNSFPLPAVEPDTSAGSGPLRLYWFSQTIGQGRGLEEVIDAAGRAGIDTVLCLRGRPTPGYLETIREHAGVYAPRLTITHEPPAPPDEMVDLCRSWDIGLAVEGDDVVNKSIALSNKALTYILAGLAVVMTDTPGQHELGVDLDEGALLYTPGDIDALAAGLLRWDRDRVSLARAKGAAWAAARRRWNWDDPRESGQLVESVRNAFGS